MKNTDPRVDAYIQKAPAFSRPILKKLRAAFHEADPTLRENIKWGNPTFEKNGIVAGMGGFKEHVAFGFWNAPAMKDPEGLFPGGGKKSTFTIKVKSVNELPPQRVLTAYVKEAVRLDGKGRKKKTKPALRPPADLLAALKKNRKAQKTFEGFSPSRRREYVEWVTDAKRDATRKRRIETAVEWLAEGKPRNWKYMKTW